MRTNEISNGQTLCKHILKSSGKKNLVVKAAPCYEKSLMLIFVKKWPGKPQIFACNSENLSDIKKNSDVGTYLRADIKSVDISSSI